MGRPRTAGARSRAVTAVAESSTTSAEVCIVATRATRTSADRAGGAKPRTAAGSASAGVHGRQRLAGGQRDRRDRETEEDLRPGRQQRRAPGGVLVAAGEELRVDVAADEMGQADQDEHRHDVGSAEGRGRREAPDLGRQSREPARARERAVERDAGDPDEHEAVLEKVRPHDRELAPERGIGHEDGGREEDRGQRPDPEGRAQDDLSRLGQQGEPHDLGNEDERAPRSAARESRSSGR